MLWIRFRHSSRALIRFISRASWLSIVALLGLVFFGGAALMPFFEGAGSPLAILHNYTWWFIVTATTVGYGDMAPASLGGRLVAVVVMLFGIGAIAVVVGKVADQVFELSRRRMRGMADYRGKGHLVVFGYHQGDTERLIDEIRADSSGEHCEIVLCAQHIEENPLPEQVHFIRGPLDSVDVLERASASTAAQVLICGSDDNETLVVALAVRSVNNHAHIVAHVTRPQCELHLARVDRRIECVRALSVPLMVQAIQDAGATAVIQAMLSNTHDDTLFRIDIPATAAQITFGALRTAFQDKWNAKLLAYAPDPNDRSSVDLNPPDSTPIAGGMCVYYLATRRLSTKDAGW